MSIWEPRSHIHLSPKGGKKMSPEKPVPPSARPPGLAWSHSAAWHRDWIQPVVRTAVSLMRTNITYRQRGIRNWNIQVITYLARVCSWSRANEEQVSGCCFNQVESRPHTDLQLVERPVVHMDFIMGLGENQSRTIVFPLAAKVEEVLSLPLSLSVSAARSFPSCLTHQRWTSHVQKGGQSSKSFYPARDQEGQVCYTQCKINTKLYLLKLCYFGNIQFFTSPTSHPLAAFTFL